MECKLTAITDWPQRAHAANYCVKLLAQDCGVSLRTLERFFHDHKGEIPHDWLARLRMERGDELLAGGKLVKQAAAEAGYGHAQHFSRDFKKHFGRGPASRHKKAQKAQSRRGCG